MLMFNQALPHHVTYFIMKIRRLLVHPYTFIHILYIFNSLEICRPCHSSFENVFFFIIKNLDFVVVENENEIGEKVPFPDFSI